MGQTMIFLAESLARRPLRSQSEACLFAARLARASGAVVDESNLRTCAEGLAAGLFGEAYEAAPSFQRSVWIGLAEKSLRAAHGLGPSQDREA